MNEAGFAYNRNTGEVHDLRYETNSCQLRDEKGAIRADIRVLSTITTQLHKGQFEWCHRCVGQRSPS